MIKLSIEMVRPDTTTYMYSATVVKVIQHTNNSLSIYTDPKKPNSKRVVNSEWWLYFDIEEL